MFGRYEDLKLAASFEIQDKRRTCNKSADEWILGTGLGGLGLSMSTGQLWCMVPFFWIYERYGCFLLSS